MTDVRSGGWWLIERIRDVLSEEMFLVSLCGARRAGSSFDVREGQLERVVCSLVATGLADSEVFPSQRLGRTLSISGSHFPLQTRPEVVFKVNGEFHLCEVKSGRVDDSRSQCVVGRAMGLHLASLGHMGKPPWEVEQDILKLIAFMAISAKVRSATLILVDAYQGRGQSWVQTFQSEATFKTTMRTEFIRERADYLLSATQISPLVTPSLRASLIVCKLGR